jgi:hypothetical protein
MRAADFADDTARGEAAAVDSNFAVQCERDRSGPDIVPAHVSQRSAVESASPIQGQWFAGDGEAGQVLDFQCRSGRDGGARRGGAERSTIFDVDHAGGDRRRSGVGVRVGEAERAGACLGNRGPGAADHARDLYVTGADDRQRVGAGAQASAEEERTAVGTNRGIAAQRHDAGEGIDIAKIAQGTRAADARAV